MINFDTMMLACASRELELRVTGAKVERIAQPTAYETLWTLFIRGTKLTLLIDSDATSSRMHLTRRARHSPPNPPAFCMLLRKHLGDAFLEGIEHPLGYGERVARLVFAGADGNRYNFYVELMGRHSNQILTDANGRVLGAIKRVTPDMSRFREVRPGIEYTLPPRQKGAKRDVYSPVAGNDLPQVEFADEKEALDWVGKTFSGLSPLMAKEAIARRPDASLTSEIVWYGINDLLNYARLAEYWPINYTDSLGRIIGAYPVMLVTIPKTQQVDAISFSAALDDACEALEQSTALHDERIALISALTRARKVCEREAIDVEEGLANSERADEYRVNGELILAHQSKIKPGDESAMLLDYEIGEEREILLDSSLSLQENAERYFKKYRKARDARERLEERKLEIEARLDRVDAAIPLAQAAASLDSVHALASSINDIKGIADNQGGVAASGQAGETQTSPYPGYRVKIYRSVDGWEILVGENAESNDYLTTKVASPSDIWLHARAQTSAHAIIRSRNRPAAVSAAALRYAAEQVAKRSTAKHSRLVPVDYTLRKFVRKPRGSKPGQVIYSREKTLDVSPEVAG